MCIYNVVASWARFGPGVMACLVAKDALERAVALAGDTVSAGALVIVVFHCMIAVALRTPYFAFRYWTFPGKVLH